MKQDPILPQGSANYTIDPELEENKNPPPLYLREDVTVTPLKKIPEKLKHTKIQFKDKRRTPIPAVKVPLAGAGASVAVPVDNLREISDPISPDNRKKLTDAAKMDPTIKPALKRRKNGLFANGYVLKLALKSSRDPTGKLLNDMEKQTLTQTYETQYQAILKRIEDWDNEQLIKTKQKMKIGFHAGLAQGHYMIKIFPGFSQLTPGQMPVTLKHVASEDIRSVIVDSQTFLIVGIRIGSHEAKKEIIVTPDEMVWVAMGDTGLTMEEIFYGTPEIEHLLQMSRINRRAVNYDYAKAIVSSYQAKLSAQVPVEGTPEEKDAQLKKRATDLASEGTDVVVLEASPDTKVESVAATVNHEMMSLIREDIDQNMMNGCGVTRLQMQKTDNLNRDNATIMEIENIRNVRTPDEESTSEHFETQLYNKLFAHLTNTPFSKLPVKTVIERIEPKDETTQQPGEKPTQQMPGKDESTKAKADEISSGQIQQEDADTNLGS